MDSGSEERNRILGPIQPTTERGEAQGGSALTEGRARGWRTDRAGSRRPSDVAMVQATDFGDGNDPAEVPPLNWPAVGCILVEREVIARPVVVREVAGEGAAQVPFAEDEDVIQTLAPNRAAPRRDSARGCEPP